MRGLFVLIIPTSEVSKEVHEEIHDGALAVSDRWLSLFPPSRGASFPHD